MRRRRACWIAASILALVGVARADFAPVRGHLKGQAQYLSAEPDSVAASLGHDEASAASLDLRAIADYAAGGFGFHAEYWLRGSSGSAVELRNALEAVQPALLIDRDATRWLPLDDVLVDREDAFAAQSFDRFSVSYTTERWVFKLGRQAYTWGNGIVFRPFDLFDPFAPDVIDDSYKPGIDSVYAQRLFADGSDVAALIVPRRDPATGRLSHSMGSAALKWHRFGASLQTDWLVARDYRDTAVGVAMSGALGEAVWRFSVVPVRLDGGGTRTSIDVNVEHAWQWRGRNVSGFVEYFRNGFGRDGRGYALDELDSALVMRLARGQAFDTGRDYLAAGMRLELSPLLEIDPVLLINLGDRSALALVRGSRSITQDLSVDFGLRLGIGPSGTEFGGLRTRAGAATFYAPPARAYARLSYYF